MRLDQELSDGCQVIGNDTPTDPTFHAYFAMSQAAIQVAGALYLFSGAIFPLEVLPAWLRPIGYAMPITYWLELMRRSLIGEVAEAFPTLAQFSNLQLIGILIGLTIIFALLSVFIFRWCDYRARELDRIKTSEVLETSEV